ncbi:RagB/SusD family nutrient uptake outer membrane protein [Pararcticibacter amylolyticus]|uniref:RagB/SusD family nutrient uptake outer membrane protein n=2 Tax=Pararcticibacter amylolyticus TaxID=2173175 RepID=A0A2U2PHE7_9SPHI|nr:RagB/SusD family nutrient uptake outer membrane protein [Pararcticibacter amylolyticus]
MNFLKNIRKGRCTAAGVATVLILSFFASCKNYLDVIPDNVATIDNAFAMRSEAIKYLYACYSYMPKDGDLTLDPAILGGDEIWALYNTGRPEFDHRLFNLARGLQNSINPIGQFHWDELYKGIRDCNIFLENINRVPDLTAEERSAWIAEVKFLKAYYHFYLLRMYGAVPLMKESIPVDADISQFKVARSPADSCFSYINTLLNEAKDKLPMQVSDPMSMLGRITRPIAYSLKAKVLVTAASPLFNGNTDQTSLKNTDGTPLFNTTYSPAKWDSAAAACKAAIDICHQAGNSLFKFTPTDKQTTQQIRTQMSLRNAFNERWNSEIIWGNTQSIANLIQKVAAVKIDHSRLENARIMSELAPPLKIADMFYTDKGIPINEDNSWNQSNLQTKTGTSGDELYIRRDYVTSANNFNREPRFYAWLGFDGGVWYAEGDNGRAYDNNPGNFFYVSNRKGQPNGKVEEDYGPVTGYYVKKYVHYENVQGSGSSDYSVREYPWPVMRLAQLYLLYAEALNESQGPVEEVHQYIDLVRARAGLQPVRTSWTNYSNNPGKYTTKEGMRDIIQTEELIELAFEGHRFWDLRRWKRALEEFNRRPVQGWDIDQSSPQFYYRPKMIFQQRFMLRDYFWPISDYNLVVNPKLVQNIGW